MAHQDEGASAGKYPRTPHLSFSPGRTPDDIGLESYAALLSPAPQNESTVTVSAAAASDDSSSRQIELVITEKLDGGNCCFKDGMLFARTHKSPATHERYDPVKQLFKTQIAPVLGSAVMDRLEFYGENMVAVHSIDYTPEQLSPGQTQRAQLPSPFFLLAVFDKVRQMFFSWTQLEQLSKRVDGPLPLPPVLFRGVLHTEEALKKVILDGVAKGSLVSPGVPAEGFVVRTVAGFPPHLFDRHVAKFVRPGHNQIDDDNFGWAWKKSNFAL